MVVAALTADSFDPRAYGFAGSDLGAAEARVRQESGSGLAQGFGSNFGQSADTSSSSDSNGASSRASRLRTRQVGVNLGPFGLTYTQNDLVLQPAEVVQLAQEDLQNASGPVSLSSSDLQRLNQALAGDSQPRANTSRTTDPARAKAAAAYARTATSLRPAWKSLLAVA